MSLLIDDSEDHISAPLLADGYLSLLDRIRINPIVDTRSTIIDSLPVVSTSQNGLITNIDPFNVSISQVDIDQTSTYQTSIFENSPLEISSAQVGVGKSYITQVGSFKNNIIQSGKTELSITEIGLPEVSISSSDTIQVSPTQIGSTQIRATQIGATEYRANENGSAQINPTQVNPAKIQPTEVSIPSRITSQQFFSGNFSHNASPNLLTDIYNTAQTLWHTTTPIDLTFKIQDLPSGQLVEGTINSYNTNGTPKTATITIDNDANGVGWFLDTTPQKNSEFTGLDTYLQANPNSPASGKYDLLTAILHEMGHTLGIINGYSEFDKHIKSRTHDR